MTGTTLVFDLSVQSSTRFNRKRLTRARHAINLSDERYFQVNESLPPLVQRFYSAQNFIIVYTESPDLQLTISPPSTVGIQVDVVGFLYMPIAASYILRNSNTENTATARVLYA